jgi:hypothetical protein
MPFQTKTHSEGATNMRFIAYLYFVTMISQSSALADPNQTSTVLSELTNILGAGIQDSETHSKPLFFSPNSEDTVGTTDTTRTISYREVLSRIQDCQNAHSDEAEINKVARKTHTSEFTTYAFSCRIPGNEIVSSEVMISNQGAQPEVVSYQELRFEEKAVNREQLLRTMMLSDSMNFQSNAAASPGINTLITLAKVGVPVALSFKAAKILSPVRTDWQKHYIAGAFISGATILTAEGILHLLNHRRGWGMSNTKINLLSSFAGLLSSIAAGAAKELIWDQRMGRGHPEFKDALYTAAGGASVSLTVAIPLEKLFGRRRVAHAL